MRFPRKPQLFHQASLYRRKFLYDQKRKKDMLSQRFVSIGAILLGIFLLGILLIYILFLHDAPSLDDLETNLKESSVIYDREGNQLYTIYGDGENRKYVFYRPNTPENGISEHIVHALVAMEDQTFFDNSGFDAFGILRSVFDCVTRKSRVCGGGSTISQQLIKNMLLTRERTIKRKVQELYLSWRLNSRFSKEKILELYLNKISFGGNTDGVEQATQRFFGKRASMVTPLEAAIIGSLPKSPTKYSPYSGRNALMWYIYVAQEEDLENPVILDTAEKQAQYQSLFETLKGYLQGLKFSFTQGSREVKICGYSSTFSKLNYPKVEAGCLTIPTSDIDEFLNNIQISGRGTWLSSEDLGEEGEAPSVASFVADIVCEYQTGRKDAVLIRMLEDGYITGDQFIESVRSGIDFKFQNKREVIRNPHFVFYVQEYLKQRYGEEIFAQGGWKIYTTLDPNLQTAAVDLITQQAPKTQANFLANNSALVALDNATGHVLAMVGSADFYNQEIDGEVNVITSLKQPGSTFKPLVYARAFEQKNFSPETPIYDVPTKFGNWEPKNFDGGFEGPMTLRTALAHSRNIPAVKMYFMATGDWGAELDREKSMIEFTQRLGFASITLKDPANYYWAPIALGSAEVEPLELASVYMALANNGLAQEVNPIIKIVSSEGEEILGTDLVPPTKKQIFSEGAAYLTTHILSDPNARPAGWNTYLAMSDGRPAAIKTGTSSKTVYTRGEKKTLPRDLWAAGYTPQITTVVWSGNTDGSATHPRASGFESSAIIWKKFMDFAHQKLEVARFRRPDTIAGTGNFLYIEGKKPDVLQILEPQMIEVDGLCRGKVTPETPRKAIKQGLLVSLYFPIEKAFPLWQTGLYQWMDSEKGLAYLTDRYRLTPDLIAVLESPENICDRPAAKTPTLATNIDTSTPFTPGETPLKITFSSEYEIREIRILINDGLYETLKPINPLTDTLESTYPVANRASQKLTLVFVDLYDHEYRFDYELDIEAADRVPPTISQSNSSDLELAAWDEVMISGSVSDSSSIEEISILVDGELVGTFEQKDTYSYRFDAIGQYATGEHVISIEATDIHGNTSRTQTRIVITSNT